MMAIEYVLDLGEDGEIVVVSAEPPTVQEGIIEVSALDRAREIVRVPLENAKATIVSKLKGMGKLFVSALPLLDNENFELDEFVVEFKLGIGAELSGDATASAGVPVAAGAAASATAKVMPNGNFKCTYTWKRKPFELG